VVILGVATTALDDDGFRSAAREALAAAGFDDQRTAAWCEEVEESWRLFAPIVEADLPIHGYPAGAWGPTEAGALLERA